MRKKESKSIENSRIIAVLLCIALFFSCAYIYADDAGEVMPLSIATQEFPRGTLGFEFSAQLEASGGSGEGYRFYIDRGTLPEGLVLSPDGRISGTPDDYGAFGIYFGVEDSAGNTAEKLLYVRISVKRVSFTVSNNNYDYNGEERTATVTPNFPEITPADYTVTYSNMPSQSESGSYYIRIRMHKPGYTAGTISPQRLVINQSSNYDIVLTSAEYEYDGAPHSIMPSVTPESLSGDVRVEYEGIGQTVYPRTVVAPSNVGTYRVTASITNTNYVPVTRTAVLTIYAPRVDFVVTGEADIEYDGQWHSLDVEAVPAAGETAPDYIVSYDNIATDEIEPDEQVKDAGTYRINIIFPDGNHSVGNINATTLRIRQKPVDFTVSCAAVYEYDGNTPEIDIIPQFENSDGTLRYEVIYDDYSTSEQDGLREIVNPGRYGIDIVCTDGNHTTRNITGTTEVVITQKTVGFDISNTSVIYDGTAQKASVVSKDSSFTEDTHYTVRYRSRTNPDNGSHPSVTEAGIYDIEIEFLDEKYAAEDLNGAVFEIQPKTVNFAVTNNTVTYNGLPQSAVVTPDDENLTENIDYMVTYDNTATSDVESDTEVNAIGEYNINISAINGNYQPGEVDNRIFTISPRIVRFNITETEHDYDGTEHRAKIDPILDAGQTLESVPSFKETYVDKDTGEELEAVTDAGRYDIKIVFEDSSYAASIENGASVMTVNPKTVKCSVSDNAHPYDGAPHRAVIKVLPDQGENIPEPQVTYINAQNEEFDAPDKIGEYQIKITFNNKNYTAVSDDEMMLYINRRTVRFTVANTETTYNGEGQHADIRLLEGQGEFENLGYSVIYTERRAEGTIEHGEYVTDAGIYDINIVFTDENGDEYTAVFEGEGISGNKATFTINPKDVKVTVTNNVYTYDGNKHHADIAVAAGQDSDIPTEIKRITYDNTATPATEDFDSVDAIGTYAINVDFGDKNYRAVNENGSELILIINHKAVHFTVSGATVTYSGEGQHADVRLAEGQDEFSGLNYKIMYEKQTADGVNEYEGAVTDAGIYNINIVFTDADGDEYAAAFEGDGVVDGHAVFTIEPREVKLVITDTEYTYNGEPHEAVVTFAEGEDTENVPQPTVTYDDLATDETETLENVTGVGTYAINISFGSDNYKAVVSEGNSMQLVINPRMITVKITAPESIIYDGDVHKAEAEIVQPPAGQEEGGAASDLKMKLIYIDSAEDGDKTELDSVVDAGTYNIYVVFPANDGYDDTYKAVLTEDSAKTITITPKAVMMSVSDNTVNMNDAMPPYAAKVKPADTEDAVAQKFDNYTVIYTDTAEGGVSYENSVKTDGVYSIRVVSNDKNYTAVMEDENAVFTVIYGNAVHFKITDNKAVFDPERESYRATVTPSIEGFTDYTVNYYRADDTERLDALTEITEPGRYNIEIEIPEEIGRPVGILEAEDGGEPIFILSNPVKVTLGDGNSIAANLLAETDGERLLAEFRGTRIYEDVYYSAEAWEAGDDNDLDCDRTAYFITPDMMGVLETDDILTDLTSLEFSAVYATGDEVLKEDISIRINGREINEWSPSKREVSVCNMEYWYYDSAEQKEVLAAVRKLVVLAVQAGDANKDRNINIGDANYLERRVLADTGLLEDPNADERLWLYRVCDVNHSGTVDEDDVTAILKRMREPIVRFY